jgi:Holliday junction resolvase
MGGRSYRIGRAFEYRVRDHLEKGGYFVVRSAMSHGPVDLVGLKRGVVLLVQCKMRGRISRGEREALCSLAERVRGLPILAFKQKRRLAFRVLRGPEADPSLKMV